MLILISLIILLVVLVDLTPVQDFLARRAATMLADKLKTKVSIKHVRVDFLNHVLIQGLYIEDHAHDTLLYAGEARVRMTDWFFLKKGKPVFHYIGLHDAYSHLYRTSKSGDWNYQFVIDAFTPSKPKKPVKRQNEFELDLKAVDLQRVRFHMDDAWSGEDIDIDADKLAIDVRNFDLRKKIMDINAVDFRKGIINYYSYTGGKPIDPNRKKVQVIDTTAFNTDNWGIAIKRINLKGCEFHLKMNEMKPAPTEFDPEHMDITGIDIDVRKLNIVKDTIRGDVHHLSAKERCGIIIRDMRCKATVSPNASIAENLYLATNNSILKDYYAMHYKRFPDFLDYIDKVVMVGHMHNSIVDARDVSYFAPQLRQLYPATLKMSGNARGTVADLSGDHIDITDGINTIKGNMSMKGLPDFWTTFIDFTDGEIMTSGQGIFRYAPSLRNNPNLAIEKISYAYFKGNFHGFYDNFATNGTLTTNLGTLTANVNLKLPPQMYKTATYAGRVMGSEIDLGTLFRQPDLGRTSFSGDIKGVAFDPQHASVSLNMLIKHLYYKGYDYKNITAEGDLAKKKFDGNLLIDDPNLALAFNGSLDFSGKLPAIRAKANLLSSDLTALRLTTDSIKANGDFDLDLVGSNIDNFLGYAKLYNINVVRNGHRLDVDSVTVYSQEVGGEKLLTWQSNDITAHLRGYYKLSTLPYSAQYYLSGYLPNYIKTPKKGADNQDVKFDITTRQIDSLLAVSAPFLRGFDDAQISGSLNTMSQRLTLKALIPHGEIYGVRLSNIDIQSEGDYKKLSLKANVGQLIFGDSLVNLSANATTTIGNDSMRFRVETTSSLEYGTATIYGNAYASGDSLFLYFLPSEFYLNHNKWEIQAGNRIIFSNKYLEINNLLIGSGLQQISVNSDQNQAINVNMQSLDLAQLSNITGFSSYEPDGRLSGNIKFDHLFNNLTVDGNLQATNLQLGTDTIGTVNVIGGYDGSRKKITFRQGTGIFLGNNSALKATGTIALDSASNQQIDGLITLDHVPLSWSQPWLVDLVSNIGGYADGTVTLTGTASVPRVAGEVAVTNGSFHVDYLGTDYVIPYDKVTIDNRAINLGTVTLRDRFNNAATVTGSITHNHLTDFRLDNIQLHSPNFEVLNLKDYENNLFYGNIMANVQSFSARGPFDDITLTIRATPSGPSHLYLPIASTGGSNSYSYVSFKSYGENQAPTVRKKNTKYRVTINAVTTPDLSMTMILDPAAGDAINAKGTGNINLNVASDADVSISGRYVIDAGDYTFTFKQFFKRNFIINSGSKIYFNGPISRTTLDVTASYRTMARLYDLLDDKEKNNQLIPSSELADAKTAQNVDVMLFMKGLMMKPELTFKLELPERRSVGTYAYTKLERINQNDRALFDQVASLILFGSLFPPEGQITTTAKSGAINNMSELVSTNVSSQLTNVFNKILGDPSLALEFKYKNYNLADASSASAESQILNRNEVRFGVRQNLFKDRVIAEVGSIYDWGTASSRSGSSSNISSLNGDFRIQYLVTEDGRLRLNAFRTSNYSVLDNANITRQGVGISWRKSFDNLNELFQSRSKNEMLRKQKLMNAIRVDTTRSADTTSGPGIE